MSAFLFKNGKLGELAASGAVKTMVAIPGWAQDLEDQVKTTTAVKAYFASAWAFRAVSLRADSIAAAPLKLYDKNDKEIENHPLLDLLEEVNPEWNRGDLWRYTESGNLVFGAAYWQKARAGGKVRELYYLNPGHISVKMDKTGITGFENTETHEEYARQDVIYFRGAFDPNSELQGIAALSLAAIASLSEANADNYLNAFYQNGAIPPMLLTSDQPRPDESTVQKLAAWWRSTFQGTKKQHKTAMMWNGLKPQLLSYPMKDLALAEVRQEMHRTISTALGVPELLISPTNAADLTPVAMAEHVFYSGTIMPRWKWYEEILNIELLPEYPDLAASGSYLAFDTSDIKALQEDEDKLAGRLAMLVKEGILKPEVAAVELGYDKKDVPGPKPTPPALVPFAGANQTAQPAQTDQGQSSQGQTTQTDQSQQAKADMERWQRKALNALRQGKSPNVPFESDAISDEDKFAMASNLAMLAELKRANDLMEKYAEPSVSD